MFEAGELEKSRQNANTLMEENVNRFWSLGGGHTALLSYNSHRGYFKASNCKNSALFLRFSDCWQFNQIGRVLLNHAFDRIAGSIWFQAQREDVAWLMAANLVLLVVNLLTSQGLGRNSTRNHEKITRSESNVLCCRATLWLNMRRTRRLNKPSRPWITLTCWDRMFRSTGHSSEDL